MPAKMASLNKPQISLMNIFSGNEHFLISANEYRAIWWGVYFVTKHQIGMPAKLASPNKPQVSLMDKFKGY